MADDAEVWRPTVVLEVYRLAESLGPAMDRFLAGSPLGAPDFGAYSLLGQIQPCTPSVFAEQAGVAQSTVSAFIKRLDKRGHLERTAMPTDRRSFRIALNAAGLAALSDTNDRYQVFGERVHRLLGGDLEAVRGALARLDGAVRLAAAGHGDRGAEAPATRQLLPYDGAPLTMVQADEVRGYVSWLRHRDGA
ncbi:MAG: DNA-binding MarR family transcriptional regulator [Myxococcota bacterium]|jgi:DNA-binding MarR family transcriptional regulator